MGRISIDRFNNGVEFLDYHHRVFENSLKELSDIVKNNEEENRLYALLSQLEEYTEQYLIEEEKSFLNSDCNSTTEHKNEHNEFRHFVSECVAKHFKRVKGIDKKLLEYLLNWQELHINKADKEIEKCIVITKESYL